MKKFICAIASIALLLSLVACAAQEQTTQESALISTATNNTSLETDEPVYTPTESSANYKEPETNVEITYPATWLEDTEDFDPSAYVKENGFISATVNSDGSVTVIMTGEKHKELVSEITKNLEENFSEYVDGEDTPYIKEISHNEDFSKVEIKVVRSEYENTLDFTVLAIALIVPVGQVSVGFTSGVEITVIDVDTGDIISVENSPNS